MLEAGRTQTFDLSNFTFVKFDRSKFGKTQHSQKSTKYFSDKQVEERSETERFFHFPETRARTCPFLEEERIEVSDSFTPPHQSSSLLAGAETIIPIGNALIC